MFRADAVSWRSGTGNPARRLEPIASGIPGHTVRVAAEIENITAARRGKIGLMCIASLVFRRRLFRPSEQTSAWGQSGDRRLAINRASPFARCAAGKDATPRMYVSFDANNALPVQQGAQLLNTTSTAIAAISAGITTSRILRGEKMRHFKVTVS